MGLPKVKLSKSRKGRRRSHLFDDELRRADEVGRAHHVERTFRVHEDSHSCIFGADFIDQRPESFIPSTRGIGSQTSSPLRSAPLSRW